MRSIYKAMIAGVALAAGLASATIIQGEVSPGMYPNIAVDALGRLLVVSSSSSTPSTVGTFTDRSGTLASAGVSQVVIPANANRKYLLIQNTGDQMLWCNETANANQNQPSFMIPTGSAFVMEGTAISVGAFNCVGAVAGKSYTAKEM